MSLGRELEKLKYDKRLTDWYVNNGKLSKEDFKKHLESLPDLASNIDHFGLAEEAGGDQDPFNGENGSGHEGDSGF
jgi:hypothetical protein